MTNPCGHYADGAGVCGTQPTREYLTGDRCKAHTPAKLAGRAEIVPDPARTLVAIYQACHGHPRPTPAQPIVTDRPRRRKTT